MDTSEGSQAVPAQPLVVPPGGVFVDSSAGLVPLATTDRAPPVPSGTAPNAPGQAGGTPLTSEFFLRTLQMNTEHIIKSFTSIQSELSRRVNDNELAISANAAAVKKNECAIGEQGADLTRLNAHVRALEACDPASVPVKPAQLGDEYLRARRAIRLWPVPGITEEEIWEATGDFIHGPLGVPTQDIGHDDIELVERVVSPSAGGPVHDEVLVTLKDRKVRDWLMVNSVNLAGSVDVRAAPLLAPGWRYPAASWTLSDY